MNILFYMKNALKPVVHVSHIVKVGQLWTENVIITCPLVADEWGLVIDQEKRVWGKVLKNILTPFKTEC